MWPWIAAAVGFVAVLIISRLINSLLSIFFRLFNRGFNLATDGYVTVVGWSLRASLLVLLIYGGMIYGTYYLFARRRPDSFRLRTRAI